MGSMFPDQIGQANEDRLVLALAELKLADSGAQQRFDAAIEKERNNITQAKQDGRITEKKQRASLLIGDGDAVDVRTAPQDLDQMRLLELPIDEHNVLGFVSTVPGMRAHFLQESIRHTLRSDTGLDTKPPRVPGFVFKTIMALPTKKTVEGHNSGQPIMASHSVFVYLPKNAHQKLAIHALELLADPARASQALGIDGEAYASVISSVNSDIMTRAAAIVKNAGFSKTSPLLNEYIDRVAVSNLDFAATLGQIKDTLPDHEQQRIGRALNATLKGSSGQNFII